ncbi:MAG: ribbon-helix-helix protein, CopG family [Gemmataceae bacterium]|nr:ribbon-helix-helix protein, CopG family [Gemmataceae bacterium]
MSEKRLTDEELAREAQLWDSREATPADWDDAPDSVPRAAESEAFSIRLPKKQLALLEEFARRQGISCHVLIKRWLDDRMRSEYASLKGATGAVEGSSAS